MRTSKVVSIASLGLLAVPSAASETTTFIYDELGRLVQTSRSGSPSGPIVTAIGFDNADNRTKYMVGTQDFHIGDKLYSADNRFYMTLQSNGQLAVVQVYGSVILWTSGSATQAADVAKFQSDGKLAIYSASGAVLWSNGVSGSYVSELTMRTDGNLVVSRSSNVLWQSGSSVWVPSSSYSDGYVSINPTYSIASVSSNGNYNAVTVTPPLNAGTYTITWTVNSTISDTGILPHSGGFVGQFTNNGSVSKSATVTVTAGTRISLFHRGDGTSVVFSNVKVSP